MLYLKNNDLILEDMGNSHLQKKWIRYTIFILISIGILSSILFYLFPMNISTSDKQTEKVVYFADNMTSAHQRIIELFNTEHAGKIKVVAINLDHHKFNTNKRKALITHNLRNQRSKVDIFAIDYIWLPRFVKWAEALEPYITKSEIEQILTQLLPACYNEGELYALPFFYDLGVLFYRDDIISSLPDASAWKEKLEAGITWDQMKQLKQQYFPQTPVYVLQGSAYEGLICNYLEIAGGLGIPIFYENNFIFNKPDILRLNTFIYNLIYKDNVISKMVVEFDERSAFQYAFDKDIPFVRAWVTNICNLNFTDDQLEKMRKMWIAPLPRKRNLTGATALGGWNLIISKYSRNKKEAAQFLKFVISEKVKTELLTARCHLPILRNIKTIS